MERLLAEAKDILAKEGPEARAEFLRSHGVESQYKGGTKTLPKEDTTSDDVECIEPTQCDGQIEVNISLDYFRDFNLYSAGLQVRYLYSYYVGSRGNVSYDGPVRPKDGFGLIWNKSEWQITDPDTPANSMNPPEFGSWDNGSWINTKNGTGFRIDDNRVCTDSGQNSITEKEWSDWASCSVNLDTQEDWSTDSEVRGEYVYTYNANNVSLGVSASFPAGVSVSASGSTSIKKEDIGTNLNGDSLIVTD